MCSLVLEELLPLAVGKLVIVQGFQLAAQIGDQVDLLVDLQIRIALLGEQLDELTLQRRFALVAVGAVFHRLVGGDHGVFGCSGDDIVLFHIDHLSTKYLLYRSSIISYTSQKELL